MTLCSGFVYGRSGHTKQTENRKGEDMESRTRPTEIHRLARPVMRGRALTEDQQAQDAFADAVADRVVARIVDIRPFFLEQAKLTDTVGEGVRVVSVAELAKSLRKDPRLLKGLETAGVLPRRRQITDRRVGYLAHEVDGIPAESVKVRDHRKVYLEALARKLGVHPKTIVRIKTELPPMIDSRRWYERDIDEWLLNRPLA